MQGFFDTPLSLIFNLFIFISMFLAKHYRIHLVVKMHWLNIIYFFGNFNQSFAKNAEYLYFS